MVPHSDVLDNIDIARLYLASHVRLDQGGEPFADILNELSPSEVARYRRTLQLRRYEDLAPKDAVAARQTLLEIVDLATEQLQTNMEVLRQIAELDAASASERASWDDSVEGLQNRSVERRAQIWPGRDNRQRHVHSRAPAAHDAATLETSGSLADLRQREHLEVTGQPSIIGRALDIRSGLATMD